MVSMLPEQHRREQGILKAAFYRERLLPLDSLSEIVHLHQWINWQYRLVHGELRKVPIIPRNGHNASTTDSSTWGTIHQAIKRLELSPVDGIGLVVTQADPYCFVDIDHSADKKKRIITSELAQRVVTLLDALTAFPDMAAYDLRPTLDDKLADEAAAMERMKRHRFDHLEGTYQAWNV